MAATRGQRSKTHRSVLLLIAVIALVSLLGWVRWGWSAPAIPAPFALPAVVLLVAFALAEILLVNFEFRGNAQALTLGELPLLVGLVFCSPAGLLVARLGGSLLALAGYFRQSREKLAFNIAMHSLKILAAVAVYRAVLGDASPVSTRGWGAALAAAVAADVVSHTLILIAIAITAGRPPSSTLGPMALTASIAAATNTGLALLAVTLLWHEPSAVVLLGFVAAVYSIGYRAHTEVRRRYANLERLYRFAEVLSGAFTEQEVIEASLRESCELLGADLAVAMVPDGSLFQRYTRRADCEVEQQILVEPGRLEAEVLRSGATLLTRHTRDDDARAALEEVGFRDAMAAPFAVGEMTGVLVVADRASEVSSFDEDSLRLFETLAKHSAVALHGGRLLEQLRQEAAAKEYQALHDHLTGLANRTLFAARVEESLESAEPGATTVLLMDFDRFKEINDTLGHLTGDEVLRQIADRLAVALGRRGTVARLGGDEFAVVSRLSGGGSTAAHAFAEELRAVVEAPVVVDDMVLEVQASVGIALAPDHGNDPATLLQRADVAMYDAKRLGTGVAAYAFDNDHYTPWRLSLVSELRSALAEGGLELYYQPQVQMSDRRVLGVEALLRWEHPRHGFISPDECIPIAESSGLIRPLTSWLIETAVRDAVRWRDLGHDLFVAVNVSPRSIADDRLVREVESRLRESGLRPDRLVLELTETSVMTDLAGGEAVLEQLSATGALLSIDDFGTGYSSLSRLARLPVDEVKIDRSFVTGMEHDESNTAIVRSTIDLARNLGLRVVAEGVETPATWEALAALRCDSVQGYLVSRPVPAAAFEQWLTTWDQPRRRSLADPAR